MTTILPDFNQATFDSSTVINNPYFPLTPGTIFAYEAEESIEDDEDENEIKDEINGETEPDEVPLESNQVFVTYDTKEIAGVESVVVRDVEWEEGVLVEETYDWYAQDNQGNVWYMGEIATNYEYDDDGNFIGTNLDGSWEAGVDGALPGYIMKANPQVGDKYYQEFFLGEAEDQAEVVSLDASVSVEFGDFDNLLKVREFNPFDPGVFEFKYYASGIGQILADEGITEQGGEPELSPELVGIFDYPDITLPALNMTTFENSADIDHDYFPLIPGTLSVYEGEEIDSDTGEIEFERHEVLVTDETKDILGITSRVVEDQEFDDGLLVEEKEFYYAQDSVGNVWLLGEAIVEYEYDEAGNLVETDESDSWLAGQDQSLPGLIMEATPDVGEAYYQRFDLGDAEEQAEIVDTDTAVTVEYGDFDNVVQIQEFSELEPDGFDYMYYAPDVGRVLEQEIDENGDIVSTSELISTTQVNQPEEPQFEPVFGSDQADVIEVSGSNGLVFGGAEADLIDASASGGNNRIYAGSGDDTLILSTNDRAFGGSGTDSFLTTTGGDNIITGGADADEFWIAVAEIPEMANTITDMTIGEDVIGVAGLGIGEDDLSITQNGSNVLISLYSQDLAILLGVDAASLSAADFVIV